MAENYCNKQTFASIVKTILLFLENNNLKETACVFRNEISKKLKNVCMDDVAPRTVILRPMDVKTSVDACVSDENLIICISDVNSSGFDDKRDNAAITTDSDHCFDAELLQNTENILEHDEDELMNVEETNINEEEIRLLKENAANYSEGETTPEPSPGDGPPSLVSDEEVASDMQESTDQNVEPCCVIKNVKDYQTMSASPKDDQSAKDEGVSSMNGSKKDSQSPKDNQSPNGSAKDSQSPNGSAKNSQSPNGSSKNSQSPNGSAKDSQSPNASAKNSQSPNGSAKSPNGSAKNSQSPNGSAKESQSPNESSKNSQSPNGSAKDSQSANGSSKNSQSPNGSAKDSASPNVSAKDDQIISVSTKDDQSESPSSIEQEKISDEKVISETSQTSPVRILCSQEIQKTIKSREATPTDCGRPYCTRQINSPSNKLRPKPNSPKKSPPKSVSPTRRMGMSYCKLPPHKAFNCVSNCKPPAKYQNDRIASCNKVNKVPVTKCIRNPPTIQQKARSCSCKPHSPPPSLKSPVKEDSALLNYTKPVIIEEEPEVTNGIPAKSGSVLDAVKLSSLELQPYGSDINNVTSEKLEPHPLMPDLDLPQFVIEKTLPFCQLDYVKIKQDLIGADDVTKQKILQALRWRLTRTETKVRDHNLVCYITHDLLNVGNGSDFFEQCFKPTAGPELQEEVSRFINTLASMSMGREYLEKCSNLIQILLPILMKAEPANFENLTRQFVMATIQKLSLGGKIRKLLINEGIVEWLVTYILTNHKSMTDYEAEYSVALFSNLCIHKPMRELCEIMADETAQLLTVLVYTPHKCCLPYLSGILGSLLTNDAINKRAAELNIQEKLKYLAEIADDYETKQQLEFIIQLHESSSQNKFMYDVVEEPQVYSDYLECELGTKEPSYANPVGEGFLDSYCATFANLETHVHVVKRSCSYGLNKSQSSCRTAECANEEANSEVVSQSAANKQMSKIEIFKDMFNQVREPSPQITTLCRLNYRNLNQPISIPLKYSSDPKGKYSCRCYKDIKSSLEENPKPPRSLQNSGCKPNNVVYGPLVCPKNFCSIVSVYPCGGKQYCGVKS